MEVLHPRCAGLDVHKDSVVAAVRLAETGTVHTEVRRFDTTTPGLLALGAWLAECGCTHAAMEATGVYWKPVWHVLSDGERVLILANAVLHPADRGGGLPAFRRRRAGDGPAPLHLQQPRHDTLHLLRCPDRAAGRRPQHR